MKLIILKMKKVKCLLHQKEWLKKFPSPDELWAKTFKDQNGGLVSLMP